MTDVAIALCTRRNGVLDITPFADIPDDAWRAFVVCRYLTALFQMSWSGATILFN